ncbi:MULTISPECIES: PadR family transcriptional regulator [Arthrobacter]|uniref:PadR family transcriptional regulator n=2 Tax=Arthrobacter TaxID=1663 RepID=A0ABU9KJH9_9MICC|nr:PadR family transcriptional regulator [Arthrobacter sp. YJM1]MDP5227283.1 PadR family transcriptional regulator [Arthrobacter sp. YJM1]
MPPVFAHGALRLYLLALLEDGAKHGYELIKALSDRFNGTYSPSAGTIYPRLAKLEEEGLVTTQVDGRRTSYTLTEAGRHELERRRQELNSVEDDITASIRRLADTLREDIGSTMHSLKDELTATSRQARAEAASTAYATTQAGSFARSQAAEQLVQGFRSELLMLIRLQKARGELSDVQVDSLRRVLDRARAEAKELFER